MGVMTHVTQTWVRVSGIDSDTGVGFGQFSNILHYFEGLEREVALSGCRVGHGYYLHYEGQGNIGYDSANW